MKTEFVNKYLRVSEKKNSFLCTGLDPAIPQQRETNVIPSGTRLSFMKHIIEEVSPYSSVIKINRQYINGLTTEELQEINDLIHLYPE